LAGLQGAGKTTTAAKLAAWFKQQGASLPDRGRPPTTGGRRTTSRPRCPGRRRRLLRTLEADRRRTSRPQRGDATRRDVVIIDTAGRLSIDEALMDEVRSISKVTLPHYTFLVIDAVTGQDAVVTAAPSTRRWRSRHHRHEARLRRARCAVLSARASSATGRLRLVRREDGRFRALPPRPDGLTDPRMGDVLSLIEQAEQRMDSDVLAEGAGE